MDLLMYNTLQFSWINTSKQHYRSGTLPDLPQLASVALLFRDSKLHMSNQIWGVFRETRLK